MRPTLGALTAASALFALDEYMPVPARVMQINVGMERSSIAGQYLSTWESDGVENRYNPLSLPLQGKFGLMDNLEGSMALRYLIEDESGKNGLDRPVLALKYGEPVTGIGGFLAISLPMGFEDIMNAGNYATMTFGGMYVKTFPLLKLFTNASYSFNTEDSDKDKIDNLRFFAKPEYSLPFAGLHARKQYLGINLAATYDFYFNRVIAGESVDEGAHLFQIAPGLFYTFNKILSAEVTAPFTLSGQNLSETRAVKAQLFFTLDEGLYNAL